MRGFLDLFGTTPTSWGVHRGFLDLSRLLPRQVGESEV